MLLYGTEALAISKGMGKTLEAFIIWCCQRVLKISWLERTLNGEVKENENWKRTTGICENLADEMHGHVMRRGDIESLIVTGRVTGRRGRGRQREKYMDGIVRTLGGWKTSQTTAANNKKQRDVGSHGRQRLQGDGAPVRKKG